MERSLPEPGVAFTPFGMLTWSETRVAGLQLGKDGGTWIQTTIPQASESRIERVGKLKLSDTGDLEGKLTVTYIGLEAVYHRLEERHADEVERKKYLRGTADGTNCGSRGGGTDQQTGLDKFGNSAGCGIHSEDSGLGIECRQAGGDSRGDLYRRRERNL